MRSRETNIPVQANKRGKLLPVSTAVILMIAFGASFLGFSQTTFAAGQVTDRKPAVSCEQLGGHQTRDESVRK